MIEIYIYIDSRWFSNGYLDVCAINLQRSMKYLFAEMFE